MENKDRADSAHPAEEIPTASRIPGRRPRDKGGNSIMIGGGPFGPQMIVFHSPDSDPHGDDPNP